jgi:glycerophosphoryl diester phosphodiesterase
MEAGADGSEFDVHPSSDGVLVIMHDGTVDRTTNGKGKVTELSLAEIKKLDAGSKMNSKFAGEQVPTLDEMLAKLKGTPCKPVIEIKGHNIADQVLAAVRKADMVDHAVIECFDRDVIRQIRVQEPRLPCAWLCGETPKEIPPEQQADWIFNQAKECNTNFVSLSIKMLSAQRVAELHDRKMIVWVWTVDLPNVVKEVMSWGIDGIETNRPNIVRLLVDNAAKPSS